MAFHDSDVNRVARRHGNLVLHDISSSQHIPLFDGENFVHDVPNYLECGLDRLSLSNRRIPVQNLLKHLCIGDQMLPGKDNVLQKQFGVAFVRVGRPNEVHWDVRVNEDQLR